MEDNPPLEPHRADGVFEGGGVKGIAFVGALQAAADAGITEWVNVAGTSAGAIVAALLAADYDATGLDELMAPLAYRKFADYGRGGPIFGRGWNMLRRRGMAHGRVFEKWLGDALEASPLADRNATFAAIERHDLPADLPTEQREAALFRLRVIASDVSAGRMLVLPQDIEGFSKPDGEELHPETLRIVDAVRMSMSFPFFYEPVSLFHAGDEKEHLIVDGGLLSNYPIWLFDNPGEVRRHTWGFRLQPGDPGELPKPRTIRGPLWEWGLTKAIMHATMSAWDERAEHSSKARTIIIPTRNVGTLDFSLQKGEVYDLRKWGSQAAAEFFRTTSEYVNSFGQTAPAPLALQR